MDSPAGSGGATQTWEAAGDSWFVGDGGGGCSSCGVCGLRSRGGEGEGEGTEEERDSDGGGGEVHIGYLLQVAKT